MTELPSDFSEMTQIPSTTIKMTELPSHTHPGSGGNNLTSTCHKATILGSN
jgi:hypothetical protein